MSSDQEKWQAATEAMKLIKERMTACQHELRKALGERDAARKEINDAKAAFSILQDQVLQVLAERNEFKMTATSSAKLIEALNFYADRDIYGGPNQRAVEGKRSTGGYLLDASRDGGNIAREALAEQERLK